MKKNLLFAVVVLALATLFIGSTQIPKLSADQLEPAGTCSNATLKGSWGFYRTGFSNNVEVAGPYASVGILFADGNGNAKRRQAVSFNGEFVKNTASFQYEVKPDCTGKLTANGTEFAWFVIVDGGKEFYILHENNQTVYGIGKRIQP